MLSTRNKWRDFPTYPTRDVIPLEVREGVSPSRALNGRLKCTGCGVCCELLPLPVAPERLEEMEQSAWRRLELWWWPLEPEDRSADLEELSKAAIKLSSDVEPVVPPQWTEKQRDEIFRDYLLPYDASLENFGSEREHIVIARMVKGRYHGMWEGGVMADKGPTLAFKNNYFLYGPCRHLQEEADGKKACGIYGVRPRMCATFPFDGFGFSADGATWRGCGYHLDPEFGVTIEEGKARAIVGTTGDEG